MGTKFSIFKDNSNQNTKSMHQAIADLELDELWVIYPGDRKYQLTEKIWVVPLVDIG